MRAETVPARCDGALVGDDDHRNVVALVADAQSEIVEVLVPGDDDRVALTRRVPCRGVLDQGDLLLLQERIACGDVVLVRRELAADEVEDTRKRIHGPFHVVGVVS